MSRHSEPELECDDTIMGLDCLDLIRVAKTGEAWVDGQRFQPGDGIYEHILAGDYTCKPCRAKQMAAELLEGARTP